MPVGVVERARRHDVDRAADGVAVHVGRDRLHDLELGEQVRGHGVERDAAVVRLRRAEHLAVERDVVEPRVDAAHGDVAAFALVGRRRHPGQALQRLGGILVRQLAGIVGRDGVLDRGRGLLVLQRRGEREAQARDRDFLDARAEQRERLGDGAGRGDFERLRDVAITDRGRDQLVAARGNVGDAEVSAAVGRDVAPERIDAHGRVRQRPAGGGVGDAAGHVASSGDPGQQQSERERARDGSRRESHGVASWFGLVMDARDPGGSCIPSMESTFHLSKSIEQLFCRAQRPDYPCPTRERLAALCHLSRPRERSAAGR